MKKFPEDIEQKIGFYKIKDAILNHCKSELGKEIFRAESISSDFKVVKKKFNQLSDVFQLLHEKSHFIVNLFNQDVRDLIAKLEIEEVVFSLDDLLEFKALLINASAAKKDFFEMEAELPYLENEVERLADFNELIVSFNRVFDKEGEINRNATPRLSELYKDINKAEKRLRSLTDNIMERAQKNGISADSGISVRNGRPVLPILSFNKGKVPGVLHDRSSSGKVLYIEPFELVEEGNKLSEIQLELKEELFKIRKNLTESLARRRMELKDSLYALSYLDALCAKSSFAKQYKAIVPNLVNMPIVDWRDAFHPVLRQSLEEENKKAVPLELRLSEEDRIIVVSGPNAGGKSIALKTLVLLQYMAQSGIPVPLSKESVVGVFDSIFIDIGDDQSVETNLSTYSSHLTNMNAFLKNADSNALVLIDEFGTGTDPVFGGAMAEVILEELAKSKAKGLITTHYGNLKNTASNTNGLFNGAMLFEQDKLIPLFKLEMGLPGSSFTFEVASNIGLSPKLIEKAKKKLGKREKQTEELLVELEKTKGQIRLSESNLLNKEKHLHKLLHEYEELKKEILDRKKTILNEAKSEAKQILHSANKEVENTIKTIVESKANKGQVSKVRKNLKRKKENLKMEEVSKPTIVKVDKPKVGMTVCLSSNSSNKGKVLQIKKNSVLVQFGIMQSWVKKDHLFQSID